MNAKIQFAPHNILRLLGLTIFWTSLRIQRYNIVFRNMIFPVVLYGSETWSLTLKEERRLRIFENRVQRTIFVSKRDDVTREWRRLRNKEFYALYSSPNIIRLIRSRRMGWAEHVACMGKRKGIYRVLVGKPYGSRPLGRPTCMWVNNIEIYLPEVAWRGGGDMD